MLLQLGKRGIHLCQRTYCSIYHYFYSFESPTQLIRLGKGILLNEKQSTQLQEKFGAIEQFFKNDREKIVTMELADDLRINGSFFDGHKLLHIRKYHEDKPTRRGIGLRYDEFIDLMNHLK